MPDGQTRRPMFGRYHWRIPAQSVTCVFAVDLHSARDSLQDYLGDRGAELRIVAETYDEVPPVDSLLDSFVRCLSEAARFLWPDWYQGGMRGSEVLLPDDVLVRRVQQSCEEANAAWLTAAVASCRDGRVPFLPQFPAAIQVQQLAHALAAPELLIAICLCDSVPESNRLLGLARALEWLAREANAHVLALLPASLADRYELDGISSGALTWDIPEGIHVEATANGPRETGERKDIIRPILGRPHPASPGEKLLAEQLASDRELANLFQFNQPVTTVFGNRFLVDLLWPEGRVAVEVDGYTHHTSRSAFNSDRHRDYELSLSGHLILRLPHDFVVQDAELAVERIREFVRFRTQHPFVEREIPQ